MNIPDWLKCPISLELFGDPVTLSTGHTYDRANIEKWFAYGNVTCPVTMQRLRDPSLVPNSTLRHLIDQWGHTNSIPLVDSVQLSLPILRQNLQTPTSAATKLETLGLIRVLSSESNEAQASLVRSGFFELLLQILFRVHLAQNSELIGSALDCILNLWPSAHLESLDTLKREPRLASLEHFLAHGNSRIKISLCHMVEAIATCKTTHELSHVLADRQRLLKALVSLMLDKSDARESEAALRAVCGLCSSQDNRASAVREGAVDGMVSYLLTAASHLSGSRRLTVTRALATLELLVGLEAGRREMNKNQNIIGVLVKMVFRVSADQEGSEHAVGALLMLCRDSRQARSDAINAGLLTQLLLLLQSQSSPKAKLKARALLKLLRWMDVVG